MTNPAADTLHLADGYRNAIAGLGTDRDKATLGEYAFRRRDPVALLTIYRSAFLPRKIVDIPALDATRKWRAWQADTADINLIEAEERRHNLIERTLEALTAARLYGWAALYIDDGRTPPSEPLVPAAMRRNGLRRIRVLTPLTLRPGPQDDDFDSEGWGRPAYFEAGHGARLATRIHPTKLAIFVGATLPDGWAFGESLGDSVLASTMQAIEQVDATMANIASLVFEAKVDVLHIPHLMDTIASAAGSASVRERLRLGMIAKGNNGALVLDGGGHDGRGRETYEQKQQTFSGLPDIAGVLMQQVSAAADIPMTRLWGRSAEGMNATGEGDERNYFDRVEALQELEITPAMALLDECLVRSALGDVPDGLFHAWRPLRQVSEQDRAEVFAKLCEAARLLVGDGGLNPELIPLDVVSQALANKIIEDGHLPGLETALAEFVGMPRDEDERDPRLTAMPPPAATAP